MKYIKSISWFLGVSLFMFGILKFVNPFKTWYSIQILKSGLSAFSYWMGIAGELSVGITLMLSQLLKQKLPLKVFSFIVLATGFTIILMMIMASYVHLKPEVPAEVLPLKIKAPYIPVSFLLLALTNIILVFSILKPGNKKEQLPNI